MTHTCDWSSAWPTGHPLPPVDPAKLRGPEVGTLMVYRPAGDGYRANSIVRVVEQSYVWSPGECRHKGGYRNYDWSVVDFGDVRLVVNDSDLYPVEPGQRIDLFRVMPELASSDRLTARGQGQSLRHCYGPETLLTISFTSLQHRVG